MHRPAATNSEAHTVRAPSKSSTIYKLPLDTHETVNLHSTCIRHAAVASPFCDGGPLSLCLCQRHHKPPPTRHRGSRWRAVDGRRTFPAGLGISTARSIRSLSPSRWSCGRRRTGKGGSWQAPRPLVSLQAEGYVGACTYVVASYTAFVCMYVMATSACKSTYIHEHGCLGAPRVGSGRDPVCRQQPKRGWLWALSREHDEPLKKPFRNETGMLRRRSRTERRYVCLASPSPLLPAQACVSARAGLCAPGQVGFGSHRAARSLT